MTESSVTTTSTTQTVGPKPVVVGDHWFRSIKAAARHLQMTPLALSGALAAGGGATSVADGLIARYAEEHERPVRRIPQPSPWHRVPPDPVPRHRRGGIRVGDTVFRTASEASDVVGYNIQVALRDNPGGFIDQAGRVVYWVDREEVTPPLLTTTLSVAQQTATMLQREANRYGLPLEAFLLTTVPPHEQVAELMDLVGDQLRALSETQWQQLQALVKKSRHSSVQLQEVPECTP